MPFEPNPFHRRFGRVGSRQVQVRPTARGIDQRAPFKFSHRGCDQKRIGAGDTLYDNLLPAVNFASFCRIPKSSIEVQARDAGGGWSDLGLNHAAVEKKTRSINSKSVRDQPRVFRSEQVGEKLEGFGGNEFSANLMTGKLPALEQQHASTMASASDGRGTSRWPAADHNQVIHRSVFSTRLLPYETRDGVQSPPSPPWSAPASDSFP